MKVADWRVFSTWKNADEYAFGRKGQPGIIPLEDKEAYWRIYQGLLNAAEKAINSQADTDSLFIRPKAFSRERGARGHRPKDLWVSICHRGSEDFGYFPQVYMIASDRGLEIGFAASIPESDYSDTEAKKRNRLIVPLINKKLTSGTNFELSNIEKSINKYNGWNFNYTTRLISGMKGFDIFSDITSVFNFLQSNLDVTGAGSICKVWNPTEIESVDLTHELQFTLRTFFPLLQRAAPTAEDLELLSKQGLSEENAIRSILSKLKQPKFHTMDVVDALTANYPELWSEILQKYGSGGAGNGRHYTSFTHISKQLGKLVKVGVIKKLGYDAAPQGFGNPEIMYWSRLNLGISNIEYPDDVSPSPLYPEGSVKQVTVNSYERNPKARQDCINHYGYRCCVCDFDFENRYGSLGASFIHVHHIYPLASLGEKYHVDPIKDLRPVCPNCHAMLHRKKEVLSIEELKAKLQN
ncbi:HNH endonuclease [Gluconobacter cerinus]|uniref:HNH endonuclease n=1 Tax=Gluconobacter cerinus TaxID=38307 RepID=UPI001C05DEA2|nr:HNH endonuclease [Gluconobacter cerinus]